MTRRSSLAGLVLIAVAFAGGIATVAGPATAEIAPNPNVVVITLDHAGFQDVLGDARAAALASFGGAALVSQRVPFESAIRSVFGLSSRPFGHRNAGSVAGVSGGTDRQKLDDIFARFGRSLRVMGSTPVVVIFVSTSPSDAEIRGGDELGAVVMGTGPADEIARALGSPPSAPEARALTSDSTRRDGAVTSSDIAVTLAHLSGTTVSASVDGSEIRTTYAPAPFDLYQRYRDQRRLTVPIGVATAIYGAIAGLFGLAVALLGTRVSERIRTAAAWGAISIIPLGLALLEVGRFPRLTYGVVAAFLVGVTVVGASASMAIARRHGAVRAIVALGSAVLVVLAVEAAQDWPGAITPLLGGSQLDGGRFFGLPNAFIGLVLGAAVFAALGPRRIALGAALVFGAGLIVGSPWAGSDFGGAITLSAAAGLWWGLRARVSTIRATLSTGAAAVAGAAIVLVMQRYLASTPTHITHLAEGTGHPGGILGTIGERLRIGAKLVLTHPFAVIPVAGVPVALWIVLRPRGTLRSVLGSDPALTAALITVLVGSLVAYAVNDTGASALGLGFASAVSALLFVYLLRAGQTVVST
ncbi:MAG: hypothetical protein ABI828_06385 [Actinomycetota bacterium]